MEHNRAGGHLELYNNVLDAYMKSTNYYIIRSNITLLLSALFYLTIMIVLVLILALSVVFEVDAGGYLYFLIVLALLLLVLTWWLLRKYLKKEFYCRYPSYNALFKVYGEGREFIRYLIFRSHLKEKHVRPDDLSEFNNLTETLETWGQYLRRRPEMLWLFATLGGIIAASASTWPLVLVIKVIGLFIILINLTYICYTVFGSPLRRQFEVNRFIVWYKADTLPI